MLGWTAVVFVLWMVSGGQRSAPRLGDPYAWFGLACGLVFLLVAISGYNFGAPYPKGTDQKVFRTSLLAMIAFIVFLAVISRP